MPDLKVTANHLERDAYLYVRQSTLRQVAENGESTLRQYALRDRAIAAGWPTERVRVIDCDLGKSGASATARDGFQELVSEVALGKAGIVMGLEVSRLARNSADWHRLIELCSLTTTLILDEDGIYDPACFNDRLLLGLKGTMSEFELHILKARMRGGQLNKARRGELEMAPPVGLIYRLDGKLDLDPDAQVQGARLVHVRGARLISCGAPGVDQGEAANPRDSFHFLPGYSTPQIAHDARRPGRRSSRGPSPRAGAQLVQVPWDSDGVCTRAGRAARKTGALEPPGITAFS